MKEYYMLTKENKNTPSGFSIIFYPIDKGGVMGYDIRCDAKMGKVSLTIERVKKSKEYALKHGEICTWGI